MPRPATRPLIALAASAALILPVGTADAAPGASGTVSVRASADPARLDLRVLVLDDGDSGVAAVRSRLDEEGVPYERVDLWDAARPVLSAGFLAGSDAGGAYGKYSGVVLPNEAPSQLSAGEGAALAAYERGFHVRQIVSYTWPNPALGFDWPQWSGVVDGMATTVTPAAKAAGWGYLKGPVTLDDGDPAVDESYGYLAPPAPPAMLQPGQVFTPYLTAPIPGSGATGVLMGQFDDNGRESLVLSFANNQWLTHFKVLGHGVLSWLTRGISLGIYRNWFSIHSDDLFLPDARWSIAGHCTIGSDCDPATYPPTLASKIRMSPADVAYLLAWQKRAGLQIDQAFNGFGSGDWAAQTGSPDLLLPAIKAAKASIRFINHTWDHPYLGCVQDWSVDPWQCATTAGGATRWVSKAAIVTAITKNVAFARTHGLPVVASELVTGEHSGLKSLPQMPADNPNLGPALTTTGVKWTGADASRETAVRRVGGARTVPRHPMNIFYNVGKKAEEVAEYNWIYTSRADGGSGYCTDHPATETCITPLDPVTGYDDYIVPIETRIAFSHIVANDPMPHYAHQANLAEDRILYPFLDSVLATYRRTFAASAPLVNPRLTTAGAALARLQDWRATTGVTARLAGRTVTITNGSGARTYVPVTAPPGATAPGLTGRYAGATSGWVALDPGARVVVTLAADTAYGNPGGARSATARPVIFSPAQRTTWNVNYAAPVDLSADVAVFDLDWEDTTATQVAGLRARGKHAICYFSAGSWENWRSDQAAFPAAVKGRNLSGWKGEKWLDTRALSTLLPIMGKRMDACQAKGFEALDPDNVDGYGNRTGFPLTRADSLAYLRALLAMAHDRGLSMGLKNAVEIVPDLADEVDFAVNESCEVYSECGTYAPMVSRGAAILHIEYRGPIATVCAKRPAAFSTLLKNRSLDAAILGRC